MPEMQQWADDPTIGLRSGWCFGDVQGLGVHQSRLRLLDPHRQRRSELRQKDRAKTLVLNRWSHQAVIGHRNPTLQHSKTPFLCRHAPVETLDRLPEQLATLLQ